MLNCLKFGDHSFDLSNLNLCKQFNFEREKKTDVGLERHEQLLRCGY